MERRRDERIGTNLHLMCRVPARPRSAFMHDLSHTGCRLEFREREVEPGGTVVLEPAGVRQKIAGQVVWTNGYEAGVRFDRWLGNSASVALGLEEPEPVPEPVMVADNDKSLTGLLRHWMRRLSGRAA
jgi:hypothetical protein